ncbi:hypothetical protein ANCCEY_14801 [Ancylostoma ceylanicum]|uniref:Uncharacterized protein n=1 Tax=Ancylostoma ceylanicum TaxID=53326 RepID=A0A0D6LEL8_9BILA|nr:hypothetical protein ANCCEY_14801 [Ancylostoma ceylanicum]
MTQQINYTALNDFLDNQTDDISSIYLWYEKLSEYDLEGNESPAELETIFHAMKFLMSFSFTAAEELREVAEREAVAMAEKEEAWEEQKIALKEELDTLRERITVSAEAGDSTEAFRAQIDSLREENRELEKTNRDRDREMADLRDRSVFCEEGPTE